MWIVSRFFSVVIPGGGAFVRKRYFVAIGVFALFLALGQLYMVLEAVHPEGVPGWLEMAALGGAIAIWAANAAFEAYIIARNRRLGAGDKPEALYLQALQAYISGDDRKAEEILRAALRLDSFNADLLFLRAQVAAGLGNARRARRLFRKCRSFDEKGKWGWETLSALRRL